MSKSKSIDWKNKTQARTSGSMLEHHKRHTHKDYRNSWPMFEKLIEHCKRIEQDIEKAKAKRQWRRLAKLRDLLGKKSYLLARSGQGYYNEEPRTEQVPIQVSPPPLVRSGAKPFGSLKPVGKRHPNWKGRRARYLG